MRIVIQRVTHADVVVADQRVGEIGHGALVLLGVGQGDTEKQADWLADKLVALRMFADDAGKMNRSIVDIAGSVLVVSQFTLLADCQKGRRPAFTKAAAPDEADRLYEYFVAAVADRGVPVQTGTFAADMKVTLLNDGPVTFVIDRNPENNLSS